MRKVLVAVAVLAAMACVANTASAAVGTPASLAANVAATAVGHRLFAVVRVVTPVYRPVYRPRVVVPAPLVVPAPVVVPRAVYYGPRYYRPILGAPVYLDTPYVSSYGIVY